MANACAFGQTGCPPPNPNTTGWQKGTIVTYALSSFNATETSALVRAFNNWNSTSTCLAVAFQQTSDTNAAMILVLPGAAGGAPAQTSYIGPTNPLASAIITIDINNPAFFNKTLSTYTTALTKTMQHEIGHTMGKGEEPAGTGTCGGQKAGNTVMNGMCGVNDGQNNQPSTPQTCDKNTIQTSPQCQVVALCGPPWCDQDLCWQCRNCGGLYQGDNCTCHYISPVIVDTAGEGFQLTSVADGVAFDFTGSGALLQLAWTTAGSSNAFLALDRNHNGTIDNGKELFGNLTTQPKSSEPNGFLALAEFDKPENGGNRDGMIDTSDAIFAQLLLWIDANHDGISQTNEIHSLPEMGLLSISLDYKVSKWTDEFGNVYRYRAKVTPSGKSELSRWAYDVFLNTN